MTVAVPALSWLLVAPAAVAAPGVEPPAGPAPLACWDLDADDGGLTVDEILPQWQWGVPTTGPGAAYTGSRVWATGLDGSYINNNEASLILPGFDLSLAERPVLSLWHWHRLRKGDIARIEIRTGDAWMPVDPVYGYRDAEGTYAGQSQGWVEAWVDLSGLTDASQVRLTLVSDSTGVTDGWYVDDLCVHDGDVVPPHIDEVSAATAWQQMDAGPTITARVVDDLGLDAVTVSWWTEEQPETTVAAVPVDGELWAATLPAVSPGQVISWQLHASDGVNLASWPADGPAEIEVFLPAPTSLQAEAERTWGPTVGLDWAPPDAVEVVAAYRVYRDDALISEVDAPPAEVAAAGPVDRFEVAAIYDTAQGLLEGERSDPVEVSTAVPTLDALDPPEAWQGDLLRVELTGTNLLLDGAAADPPALQLGDGIAVVGVEVVHVDRAAFTLEIAADAAVGPRDAVLSTGGLDLLLEDAFTVLDGADRPALLAAEPGGATQGQELTVVLTTNTTLSEGVHVSLGEGVVVQATRVSGAQVELDVAVANDAAVGSVDVVLDDGTRVMVLADGFRVYARARSGQGCAAAPGGALVGALAAAAALLAGRRRRARR